MALKMMKNNKSPGEDGLPKEFYIHFQAVLIDLLHELYNNIGIVMSKLIPIEQNVEYKVDK